MPSLFSVLMEMIVYPPLAKCRMQNYECKMRCAIIILHSAFIILHSDVSPLNDHLSRQDD